MFVFNVAQFWTWSKQGHRHLEAETQVLAEMQGIFPLAFGEQEGGWC
jgi:hypothetical protein